MYRVFVINILVSLKKISSFFSLTIFFFFFFRKPLTKSDVVIAVQSLSHFQLFAFWGSIAYRLPCPSLSPGVSSKVCPLNQWCHLILCCTVLYLHSIFPSIRVFSNKPALRIKSPKYWSFNFSISSSDTEYSGWMNIQGWCSVALTGLMSLQSKGLLRVFSGTAVPKHQFFGS